MNHRRLAAALAALLAPALAADPFGLGARRSTAPATPPPPAPAAVPPESISEGFAAVIQKMRDKQPLTYIDFLVFLGGVERHPGNVAWIEAQAAATHEEDLPARGWALVASTFHDHHYQADRNLRLGGIDLFLSGSENQGWEEIRTFGVTAPKFITGERGETIDIAHAYAGVAALVMREGRIRGNAMARVNTGWGDSYQVVAHRVRGAREAAVGWVTCDFGRCDDGIDEFQTAPDYKPEDQRRGNRIGILAHDYLQKNRDASLRSAFQHALARYMTETDAD